MVFLFLNRFSNFLPFAKSKPSEKFLDFLEEQVRNKSPRPDKPDSVSGCAPNFLPTYFISKLVASPCHRKLSSIKPRINDFNTILTHYL